MPLKMYMPKISKYWGSEIWQFTIFRDYGIEFDFRKEPFPFNLLKGEKK